MYYSFKGRGYGVWRHFQQYLRYIVTVSFVGEGTLSPPHRPKHDGCY
jgi:hypothetical protein